MLVDRIENGIMVIEVGDEYIELPHSLNKAIKEGDKLNLVVDQEGTEERKREIKLKMQKLFKRGHKDEG